MIEKFPLINRPQKSNVRIGVIINGRDSYVSSSAMNVFESGANNSIGAGAKNISILNSSGCTVLAGITGATIINSSGVIVTENDQVYMNGHLISADSNILTFKKTISSAELLAANSTPILLVAAPLTGAIEGVSMLSRMVYNSVAYTGNTTLIIYADTATANQFELNAALESTGNNIFKFEHIIGNPAFVGGQQIIPQKGLYLSTSGGNPSTGNSSIIIYGNYRIID